MMLYKLKSKQNKANKQRKNKRQQNKKQKETLTTSDIST